MSDLLSEEETRAAFAELRATELVHVRPPGTQAVRTTVRRRRTTRVVTVAGCAALAVAGGAIAAANMLPRQSAPAPMIGAQPSVEPTDALGWAQLADDALGEGVGRPKWLAHALSPIDTVTHDVAYAGTHSAYNLTITCAGAGTVHVKVAVGTHAAEADLACGATKSEAQDATKVLALPVGDSAAHQVAVTIEPDGDAVNKAGFAYVLTYS